MNAHARPETPSAAEPPLSDGEVDFLWWFIQGSLMDADVRARLHAHWGLCRRHSLAFFAVESSFRPHLIHGCTILYSELMQRALDVLNDEGLHSLVPDRFALHFLRTSGPCHVCDLGYGPGAAGNAPPERLAQGRDLTNATRFATENSAGWLPFVCGLCACNDSPALCRPHLVAAMQKDASKGAAAQRERIRTIAAHMHRFDNSFRWEQRGTDTAEDRGALIAAIGWCSGWENLLAGPLHDLSNSTVRMQPERAAGAQRDDGTGEPE
ncbi:hypothetical protein Q8F57_045640 [Paraburkholderia terrae]|uniref:hypothetical protein n=1 Tax=Paraburkholderia terrae TaxID=311230 RepID=UPI00296B10CE|nr:hypothetical protein [Paraburkholderia terrae]MDW3660668.1 hypothetical protein [Paraburkholderia terrae]